jgi:hypothetical protein
MKEPTCISIVEEVLRLADDFVTAKMIFSRTKLSFNQISASLYSLKKYKAVDFVENSDGLWWFCTPEYDTRSKHIEMRVKENKPRRTRRSKMVAKD